MSAATIVFSQNLKIQSINIIHEYIIDCSKIYILTSHLLFPYEQEQISHCIDKDIVFYSFCDFISCEEMRKCDQDAYELEKFDVSKYDEIIKAQKNETIITNFEKQITSKVKIIMSDDLGIELNCWLNHGYRFLRGEYYYNPNRSLYNRIKHKLSSIFCERKKAEDDSYVYVGQYKGKKYVFIGKMDRVKIHIDLDFVVSNEDAQKIENGEYEKKDSCIYLSSIHESFRLNVPEGDEYAVYQIQDGYIPPVYSCCYKFIPSNHSYYAWDTMGEILFKSQNIPVQLIPFRKKLYLPVPKRISGVKKIVVVASGAGDWTAMKNRSDEDIMVSWFVSVAQKYPNIRFVYRCHPTWVHPSHQGVNSINRVAEYLEICGTDNIVLSANIPNNSLKHFELTYSRDSLSNDIKNADIVFGDHSVSMLDAGMEGTIFCSINVRKQEDFFKSMTDLGFKSCASASEICDFIDSVSDGSYLESYIEAINRYNNMIDEEDMAL